VLSPGQPGAEVPCDSVTDLDVAGWLAAAGAAELAPELAELSGLVRRQLEEQWSQRDGTLDSICRYAVLPTGKLLRPVLLLESTAAVGGKLASSLAAAAGAEAGHVASLIHDDIIDNDDLRRGRLSVQRKYGVADAIVAGDALIFHLFASLADCRLAGVPDACVVSALAVVAKAGVDLCRGQTLESELSRGPCFGVESYALVATLKTGALFRSACECGAILGGGDPESVRALAGYGERLGLAFQIRDDLLPYVSDARTSGKRETSDAQNGRWTLPVILAYERAGSSDRDAINGALGGSLSAADALVYLREVVARTRAAELAEEMAADHARVARQALAGLPLTASRSRLAYIAELAVARDR
jgi:geranylgeranyl pyrophosphate synthase